MARVRRLPWGATSLRVASRPGVGRHGLTSDATGGVTAKTLVAKEPIVDDIS